MINELKCTIGYETFNYCTDENCPYHLEEKRKRDESKKTVFKKPEEIIEGVDLNYDLLQLAGYLVSIGWTEKVFPDAHVCELHQRMMDLYGNHKVKQPEEKIERFFIHDKVTNSLYIGLDLANTKSLFLRLFQKGKISFDVFEWNDAMDTLSLDPNHSITSKFSIYDESYVVYDGK